MTDSYAAKYQRTTLLLLAKFYDLPGDYEDLDTDELRRRIDSTVTARRLAFADARDRFMHAICCRHAHK